MDWTRAVRTGIVAFVLFADAASTQKTKTLYEHLVTRSHFRQRASRCSHVQERDMRRRRNIQRKSIQRFISPSF